MTTILADHRLGVMVADSNVSDGVTVSSMRKIWRVNGALVGLAGTVAEFEPFLQWIKAGCPQHSKGDFRSVHGLVLSKSGLVIYTGRTATPSQRGWEAVGTGSMAALAAHEALGLTDPTRAVRIVCKHDNGSRAPVRTYRLDKATT